MKKLLVSMSVVLLSLMGGVANAIVTNVLYIIQYNTTSCLYDVKMIVQAGSTQVGAVTSSYNYRKASTAQLTIVVPSGSDVGGNGGYSITTGESYPGSAATVSTNTGTKPSYPRATNPIPISPTGIAGDKTVPAALGAATGWTNPNRNFYYFDTAVFAGPPSYTLTSNGVPASMGKVDVYSFVPNVSQNAVYPNMNAGDTVLLFSLSIITPTSNCGQGVRLWNNNVIQGGSVNGSTIPGGCGGVGNDPCSAVMNGGLDYNNGMGIGTNVAQTAPGGQIYGGNGISNTSQAKPVVNTIALTCTSTTSTLTASPVVALCGSTITSYVYRNASNAIVSNTNTLTVTTATNNSPYTLTVTASNGCTTTAVRSVSTVGCFVLPVKLISFNAIADKCDAQLAWEIAASDKDFERFDVQYSRDGQKFVTVGQVARNPYNEKYSYSYSQTSGKGYYRLAIVDLKGATTYSETRNAITSCDDNVITISPNPTSAISTVKGLEAGDQLKVTDMLGNVLANYISGGSQATIELANLPSGIYSVMISRNGEILKAAKITKL